MNEANVIIDIDRIVLTGFDVTPNQAERIRGLIEAELGRLLAQASIADGLGTLSVAHLDAPTIHLTEHHDHNRLANSIAQSIVQSLGGGEKNE